MSVALVGHVAAVLIVCFENALLALVPVFDALLLPPLCVGHTCICLARGFTPSAQETFLLSPRRGHIGKLG